MSIRDVLAGGGVTVAVVCGGPGGEREVSLASGDNAHRALNDVGVPAVKAVVPAENPGAYLERLECGVAVMMLHGRFGEDGEAQRILERRGVPFTGSDSRVCALAMDKNATKELLAANRVPTPRWALSDDPAAALDAVAAAGLSFPLFLKPNFGGSSVGVARVETPGELPAAVAAVLRDDSLALMEELVPGRELTVGWLGGRVLPTIELRADGVFYDYHAKYISEKTQYLCPAPLEPEMAETVAGYAAKVADLVGVRDSARVDMMLGADGPMLLEVNTLPGFTTHSLLPMAASAAGISAGELCLMLIEMAAGRAGMI